MRSVGIETLGCKVNTYESEYIINQLKEHGYEIKNFTEICDIYIINTCTVTNTSDIKSRKMIRNAIKRNPNACIIAMGCFIAANLDIKIEGLDIIIGNKDKSKIVALIEEWYKKKETLRLSYKNPLDTFEDMYINKFPGRTRAFVKIQDGCENFCSYCIIPLVRGKCRSKEKEKVIAEVTSLTNNGYQEIVLTGIHTGNYGVDINTDFASLLKELVKIEKLKRLRISSIEITELTTEVLQVIKDNPIIVDHLHIPLQSGCDDILKSMNRKYNIDYFEKILKKIRKIRPNINITTDVIVGFPGESEKMFNKTIETCQKLKLTKIHVFPFSERKNTKAIDLPNHIEKEEKKKRARELLEISKKLELEYATKYLNQTVEVLIEEQKEAYSIGHTGNYLHIKINKLLPKNTFVKVKITKIDYPYCIAE